MAEVGLSDITLRTYAFIQRPNCLKLSTSAHLTWWQVQDQNWYSNCHFWGDVAKIYITSIRMG